MKGCLELFFVEMSRFLDAASKEIERLTVSIEIEIERTRIDLAQFLCEDISTFKLDECFSVFASFCQRFKLACDENERRREVEAKNERRRKNLTNENRKYVITETEANGGELILSGSNTLPKIRASRLALNESNTDDDLATGLMELLKSTNDLSGSIYDSAYGSLRRVGSGRRSTTRTVNSYHPESARERIPNSDGLYSSNTRLGDIECNIFEIPEEPKLLKSDAKVDEKEEKCPFERFTPSRRSFSIKSSNRKLLNCSENSVEPQEPIVNTTTGTSVDKEESKDARNYWKSLDSSENSGSKGLIFTNQSNQPTAVIAPTQIETAKDSKENNSNGIARRPNVLETSSKSSSSSSIKSELIGPLNSRRNSILSPTSNNSTAAYVKPVQLTEKQIMSSIGRSSSSSSSSSSLFNGKSSRSRVPVRKDSLTTPPKPLKAETTDDDSEQDLQSTNRLNKINSTKRDPLEHRLYRSVARSTSNLRRSPPSIVNRIAAKSTYDRSKSYLNNGPNSSNLIDSNPNLTKRRVQNPPEYSVRRMNQIPSNGEPRSFMRQTSSSAAKTQKTVNLARFRF